MVNEREIQNKLRLQIDTLLLGLTNEEQDELEKLCNGSDTTLNDAHWNYNDEMEAYRPNSDGLRKYLDAINSMVEKRN